MFKPHSPSPQLHHWLRASSLLVLTVWLVSCTTTTQVITANSKPPVQLQSLLTEAERLDVMVEPFASNLEAMSDAREGDIPVSAEVRRAESRYMAFHLKDTLEQTGNWGIVRVVPSGASHHTLVVAGTILASDGEQLSVRVTATDAKGQRWIDKTYQDTASKYGYQSLKEDPFQDLYNNIANDLIEHYQTYPQANIRTLQQIGQLAFAKDLAPAAFGDYLGTDAKGQVTLSESACRQRRGPQSSCPGSSTRRPTGGYP